MIDKEEFKKCIISRKHSSSSLDDIQMKTITDYLLAIRALVGDLREEIFNEKRSTESFITDAINTQVQKLYKKYQEFVEETEEKYQQKLKNIRLSCRQQMQDALIMLKADFEKEKGRRRSKEIDKKEKVFLIKRVKHLEQCMDEYEAMLDGCSMPIVIDSKKDPYHFSSDDMDFTMEDLNEMEPIESINLRIKMNRIQQDLVREKMKSKQMNQEMKIRNKMLTNYIKENEKLKSEKMGKDVDQNKEIALKIKAIKQEYVAEMDRLKTKISELKHSLNEQRWLTLAHERKAATVFKEQIVERKRLISHSKDEFPDVAKKKPAVVSKDEIPDDERSRSTISSKEDYKDAEKSKSTVTSKEDYKDAEKKKSVAPKEQRINIDRKKSKHDYKDAEKSKSAVISKDDYKDAEKIKLEISPRESLVGVDRKKSKLAQKYDSLNFEKRRSMSEVLLEEYSDLDLVRSVTSFGFVESEMARSATPSPKEISDEANIDRGSSLQSTDGPSKSIKDTALVRSIPTFHSVVKDVIDVPTPSFMSAFKIYKLKDQSTEMAISEVSPKASKVESRVIDMETKSKKEAGKRMRRESKRLKKDILEKSKIYKTPKKQPSETDVKSTPPPVKTVKEDQYYAEKEQKSPRASGVEEDTFPVDARSSPTPKSSKIALAEFETRSSPTPKSSKTAVTEFEMKMNATPKSSKQESMEFEMKPEPRQTQYLTVTSFSRKGSRRSREFTASAEGQTYDRSCQVSREFLSDTDMKSPSGSPAKEFLSDTEMDKTKSSTAKTFVTSSPSLQCKGIEPRKNAQVTQTSQKKTESVEKDEEEKLDFQMQNIQLQTDMNKLLEQNKELLRKIRVLEQSRVIEPRRKYKIMKECTLGDVPDMGFTKTNFYEKKIQILQHSYNALRNEMYTRQTLQRQSCLMHHAGITYKLANHLPPKDQPMQVKLCSTDITNDKEGNILPNVHYEVPNVPFPSFAEIPATDT